MPFHIRKRKPQAPAHPTPHQKAKATRTWPSHFLSKSKSYESKIILSISKSKSHDDLVIPIHAREEINTNHDIDMTRYTKSQNPRTSIDITLLKGKSHELSI
ncbi:hypothetical protein PoB_006192600 [Plakobranchus ocellatus]|uniref:Uncharacterized protein n=1 Tax=Plakobranchus ocellatus TaxID=259542 RepID=A0AAV4CU76_9GAST|nr:hypothetical protein PoB_006192600 [Plakobranchus ocellatus]